MKSCKEINDIIIDYAGGDISAEEMRQAKEHLKVCGRCKKGYRKYVEIFENMESLNRESELLMKKIDWEKNAQDISRGIRLKGTPAEKKFSFTSNMLNWKILAPITTAVLLFGIYLGYLLFHASPGEGIFRAESAQQQVSLARLEALLAEKEVSGYFKEAQLVLTDLMRRCDVEGDVFYQDRLNRGRVKLLLSRSKYFTRHLDSPRLLSSRNLLQKIKWLLYEILTLDDAVSCRQLQQIQDYIRQERLLLKIRLIGKDITEV